MNLNLKPNAPKPRIKLKLHLMPAIILVYLLWMYRFKYCIQNVVRLLGILLVVAMNKLASSSLNSLEWHFIWNLNFALCCKYLEFPYIFKTSQIILPMAFKFPSKVAPLRKISCWLLWNCDRWRALVAQLTACHLCKFYSAFQVDFKCI